MIAVGVDTHKDSHYAVALDQVGQILAELSVPATSVGYAELQHWAEPLANADELVFGLEGVGSWGAGLFQHLQRTGHPRTQSPATWAGLRLRPRPKGARRGRRRHGCSRRKEVIRPLDQSGEALRNKLN
jgi:hypothetical protein